MHVGNVCIFITCYKTAGFTGENVVFEAAVCFGTCPVGQHVGAIGHDNKGL